MVILTLKDAGFSYGEEEIFKGVNLKVSKGDVLCILGPNGCGKTTLVDSIIGINKLESGKILFNNIDINTLSPRQIAKQVAYIPQKHTRHFSFSVLDVLLMGRTPYTSIFNAPGLSEKKIAEDILQSFNMYHLKNRDYTKLSGGETQLVMIMRALVQDTPAIMMDEPTAHLDFKNELGVLETIAKLVKERGRTLIMATHFPNHAFFLENEGLNVQVAFMDKQRIHLKGSPTTALTEQNIEDFYKVKATLVSKKVSDERILKHIIPIQTLGDK